MIKLVLTAKYAKFYLPSGQVGAKFARFFFAILAISLCSLRLKHILLNIWLNSYINSLYFKPLYFVLVKPALCIRKSITCLNTCKSDSSMSF